MWLLGISSVDGGWLFTSPATGSLATRRTIYSLSGAIIPSTMPPFHSGFSADVDQPATTCAPGPSPPEVLQWAICAQPDAPLSLRPLTERQSITSRQFTDDWRKYGGLPSTGTAG